MIAFSRSKDTFAAASCIAALLAGSGVEGTNQFGDSSIVVHDNRPQGNSRQSSRQALIEWTEDTEEERPEVEPQIVGGIVDWWKDTDLGNIDWDNFDWRNTDWRDVDWDDNSWSDFFDGLADRGERNRNFGICPILENIAGIGEAFQVAGDCSCEGNVTAGLNISCAFSHECVDDEELLCGSVGLGFGFDHQLGISTSVCVDLENDDYREICFGFGLDWSDSVLPSPTCEAFYGGDQCTCEIESGCMTIDCRSFLPGAFMDTCQRFSTVGADDAASFIPRFRIFDPDFDGLELGELDLPNIQWDDFDWDSFDFGWVDWGNSTWSDLFPGDGLDVCPYLEAAIGMTEDFGIEANCQCEGMLRTGMDVSCDFGYCYERTDLCAEAEIDFSYDDLKNVSVGACWNFTFDTYKQFCFTYDIPLSEPSANTCTASYGGDACRCTIGDFCLSVDCSDYLPGAKIDTCQYIEMTDAVGIGSFFPQFKIFDADFDGLELSDINFDQIQWDRFDWQNFDFGWVDWGNTTWDDLFPVDGLDVCPLLEAAIGMTESFGLEGDCSCEGELLTGMNVSCDFDYCIVEPDLCASADVTFSYDNLGSVGAGVCWDFAFDQYQPFCFSYDLPMGDLSADSCTATYGGNPCECEIGNLCLSVNCSAYLPGAEMDTCQFIDRIDDIGSFFPQFKIFQPDFDGLEVSDVNFDGIDWDNFDYESFDFSWVEWGDTTWSNVFWNLAPDADVCPYLERIIGIGELLGVDGGCSCDGAFPSPIDLGCSFDYCYVRSDDGGNDGVDDGEIELARAADKSNGGDLCATANVTFTYDNLESVGAGVCWDFEYDQYQSFCFNYEIPLADPFASSCTASYGGNPCECEIESLCLTVNCSAYLPGAEMDTCQYLDLFDATDLGGFFPDFPIFENDPPTFEFGDINWLNLDWENLDWENFGFDRVVWGPEEGWATTFWKDIFDPALEEVDICPVLYRVVEMSEAFQVQADCECSEDDGAGTFDIACSFEKECTATDPLCGGLNFTLTYDKLDSISARACLDFKDGIHDPACYTYTIPVAADATPTCGAAYGNEDCGCMIDENFCLSIDCSEHGNGLKTEGCQDLSLQGDDPFMLLPRFDLTVEADDGNVDNSDGETNEEQGSITDNIITGSRENSAATRTSLSILFLVAATLSYLLV